MNENSHPLPANSKPRNLAVLNDHVFHFITFQEYVLSQGGKLEDWLVVIYHNEDLPHLKPMCKEVLGNMNCTNYRFFPYRIPSESAKTRVITFTVLSIIEYLAFHLRQLTFDTVLVGNYTSRMGQGVAAATKANKLVYIDEGNSTVDIAKTRRQPAGERSRFSNFLRALVPMRGGKETIFFTRYHDLTFGPDDKIIPCDYRHTLGKSGTTSVDEKKVIFLGNPYVEKDYLTAEDYRNALVTIHSMYAQSGIQMIYKPHRSETKENLDSFRQQGIEVVTDAWPIEIYLMRLDRFPLHVASFVTSALNTISTLFKNQISLVSYDFHEVIYPSFQQKFIEYYQDYRENDSFNIEVRQIPVPEKP